MRCPRRCTDAQIVGILRDYQGGVMAKEVIGRHRNSIDTCLGWKRMHACRVVAEVHGLNTLKDENRWLKRIVDDHRLNYWP